MLEHFDPLKKNKTRK
jgi:hypothetical protein